MAQCNYDPTCTRPARVRGACGTCYNKARARGDTRYAPIPKAAYQNAKPCSVDGCEALSHCRNLCARHYQRVRNHGDPMAMKIKARGRGPRKHYAYTKFGDLVHREVMAEMIGRPLRKDESVHHKNGDRHDNRPENLELWSRWQPSGQRVVDKLSWASEILSTYKKQKAVDYSLEEATIG